MLDAPTREAYARTMERFLARIELFKRLPPSERQRLALLAREKRYAKGETIFRTGEPAEAVFIVKEGRVHLMNFLASGQASTNCVMAPGESFCCLPTLDRKPYPADAIAAEDSVVVRVPLTAFHETLQKNPAFLQETLCLMCSRLRDVEHRSCMSYDPVELRLAQALLNLSKKFGSKVPLTKHELAELANTTVETAIRVLSQLKQQGIVSSARGSTTIVDAKRLAQLASRSL